MFKGPRGAIVVDIVDTTVVVTGFVVEVVFKVGTGVAIYSKNTWMLSVQSNGLA